MPDEPVLVDITKPLVMANVSKVDVGAVKTLEITKKRMTEDLARGDGVFGSDGSAWQKLGNHIFELVSMGFTSIVFRVPLGYNYTNRIAGFITNIIPAYGGVKVKFSISFYNAEAEHEDYSRIDTPSDEDIKEILRGYDEQDAIYRTESPT